MIRHRRSTCYLLGFLVLWAVIELMGTLLLSRYSAFQVVWTRYLVHLVLMLAVFGWRAPGSLLSTGRPGFQLLRSMMMLIMPASWVLATWLNAQQIVIGWFWSAPLMMVVFSALFLRERARWSITLVALVGGAAAAVVFAGVSVPSGQQWLPLLGMAGSFSLYVIMTRSLRDEPIRANLFYTALGVFLALTPVLPGVFKAPEGLTDVVLFFAIGALGLVCLWCLDRAVAHAPVADTAPLFLAQVPFTFFLGWIAGHDLPGNRTLLLLAIVCVACAIPLFKSHSVFRARVSQ